MTVALRATSTLQSFHCRIVQVLANASGVFPKTQIGHESFQSNYKHTHTHTCILNIGYFAARLFSVFGPATLCPTLKGL